MSTSPGKGGGSKSLVQLRSIIENIKGTVIKEQFSLPDASQAFDQNGKLNDPSAKAKVKLLVQSALKK